MENLVNMIGGYNSLGFALLSLGTYFLGGGLMMAKNKLRYLGLIIYLFGTTLILGWVIFQVKDDKTGYGQIVPLLWAVMAIITIVNIWFKNNDKDKQSIKTTKTNCSITPKSPACAICPKKCF